MRPTWDVYFLKMSHLVGTRSTCPKCSVGVVLTKDKRVIATGYNGSPSGMAHCNDAGCLEHNNHCRRALHAEVNAILQCAENGISTKGTTLYTSLFPCWNCSLMLINAGITRIVYQNDYCDDRGDQYKMLSSVGIQLDKLDE